MLAALDPMMDLSRQNTKILFNEDGYRRISEYALGFLLTSQSKNTIMIIHTDTYRMLEDGKFGFSSGVGVL